MRQTQFGTQKRAARVDLMHQIVALHVRTERRRQADGARIIDADVDTTERRNGFIYRALNLIFEADVTDASDSFAAERLDLLSRFVNSARQLRVGVSRFTKYGDVGAVTGGSKSNGFADAAAGAADEQGFAGEWLHVTLIP